MLKRFALLAVQQMCEFGASRIRACRDLPKDGARRLSLCFLSCGTCPKAPKVGSGPMLSAVDSFTIIGSIPTS